MIQPVVVIMDVIRVVWWLFWQLLNLIVRVLWLLSRLLFRIIFRLLRTTVTHGSARWARAHEIIFSGMWGGDGIILGKKFGRFLRFNGEGYVLVAASTRSGKTSGIVIPTLLEYKGSVIVNDCKGENYATTARDRSRKGPVWALNLIEPELSDGFNPIDMVRAGTIHEADDALEIARLLIVPTEGGAHWDQRAEQLVQCLILFVINRYSSPDLRNLAKVRSLIALGLEGLRPVFTEATELGPTTLRELASGFLGNGTSDEARSIWSNAEKAIGLFSSDRPAGLVTLRSSFDMMAFNRRVKSLFLIVPEEKLAAYSAFLRVVIGCALIALTRAKGEAPPKIPTLLLLDEAAALGRLEPLETGVGYLASYARLVLVFQDLDQIERTYPKARSMIANATIRVAFGVNDLATATTIASSIGRMTIMSRSIGQSQQNGDLFQRQLNQGRAETGRHLLDPSEVLRLPRNKALIFSGGKVAYPILAKKVRYYRVWRWRGRWDRWRDQRPAPAQALLDTSSA